MASSSSSSLSPSLLQTWTHDIFPSFHGKDVRKNFLSHVLKEFERKGINSFVDNEMERGDFIGPELKRAIRESKIIVVLLSKNYASSSWCLEELAEIMKKESGQKVITIFYGVEPIDVRKQKGDFGKVFKKTCKGKGKEKVHTWTIALKGVATIAGYDFSNWFVDNEAAMIENIAAYISNKLNHLIPSRDFDRLIGMEAHMSRINQFLHPDLDEVRMIGIWGPAGIGKTTIARFLFNKIFGGFQNSAFMENIKGSYPRPCLNEYGAQRQLQKEMLSQMFHQENIVIPHLGVARGRLGDRKVLLVLDDVDRLAQLEALAKNVQWFGPRSLIIITTEYLRLLQAHKIEHIYKVDFPSNNEALQMFCKYAFNQKSPKDGFNELACEIAYRVGNLPLGLKVIGSHFLGLPKEEWPMEVSRLRTTLDRDIESILKFSYDALCDEDKDLFLHIACFFNSMDIKKVEEYLAESFDHVGQRLHVLADKSLIYIELFMNELFIMQNRIRMHNMLAQLGKKIVQSGKLRQRRFLFDHKDICEVLIDTTRMTSVVGIYSNYQLNVSEKAFEGMSNLQFLRVSYDRDHQNSISSMGPLSFISPNLRLLDLSDFPMTRLRFMNNLKFLVEFSMVDSKLEKLWDGTKILRNLKRMNLKNSKNLKELPNLSTATNLERLYLNGCSSLVELPSSIVNATSLHYLNLSDCSSLVSLPQLSDSLRYLDARNCESLEKLDCSFCNPGIWLYFGNCYKLNKEARDLLIQTSPLELVVLPSKEVPMCFTYRGYGSSATVKLNQKHLPTSTKFKACVLFEKKGCIDWDTICVYTKKNKERGSVSCCIGDNMKDRGEDIPILTEHLYNFEVTIDEMASTELVFDFWYSDKYTGMTDEINECGMIHMLE
ncbi:probable disease resistance protein RPP1 [Capsella rubella]|uniref:probable disease resistance protein RPP1 n=1 Tax=Capsella rubella TaxID=81985 RepID=UPI000CD4ECA3|nr:probable disease resistance protein RPP1 [Capsella rubella]